ncbi:hypothetical protein CBS147344_7546 [Aspergillus niger]|nr:hypothetical protein CBS147344_7546 [Aspergillus niger]
MISSCSSRIRKSFCSSRRPRILHPRSLGHLQPVRALTTTECARQSTVASHGDLFRYTSGRWLVNEHLRLSERFLEFDVLALQSIVSTASGHSVSELRSFTNLSEGGYNRVFEATFSDEKCVLARLPYPSTAPEHYAVASEAATLDYLRLHGLHAPEVYAWCSTKANPVGAEYIVIEKLDEIHRRRVVHFLYAALTKRLNQDHYDAIFDQSVILRQRLFKSAGTPWEGESVSLRAELIRSISNWSANVQTTDIAPPVEYPEDVVRETFDLDMQQKEADVAMEQMRHALGVDVLGWVPNEGYEAARRLACDMKVQMLEAAETPDEVIAIRDHFPFDDFDERS